MKIKIDPFRKKHQYRENIFAKLREQRIFVPLSSILSICVGWKENLYYEVNACHLSLLRKEVEEKGKKGRRTIHATLDREDTLAQLEEKLSFSRYFSFPLYQFSFFFSLSFFLSLPFFYFIFFFYKNQPPSLINSFLLPGKLVHIHESRV